MRRSLLVLAVAVLIPLLAAAFPKLAVAQQVAAAGKGVSSILYSDRTTFENTLGNFITDDFAAPDYLIGDIETGTMSSVHSDAQMTAVLGETIYQSTAWTDSNFIYLQGGTNWIYCSGCNGSARPAFTSTSVGSRKGVYGVGFDLFENFYASPTHAFVTFGDGTTADFELEYTEQEGLFWGITSRKLIASIHLGGPAGVATSYVYWKLDNLTIGSARKTRQAR